jgi:hypothetical protein
MPEPWLALRRPRPRCACCAQSDYQQRALAIYAKYDCNPAKSLVSIFVQFPVFVGFFSALRAFSAAKVGGAVGGLAAGRGVCLRQSWTAAPLGLFCGPLLGWPRTGGGRCGGNRRGG